MIKIYYSNTVDSCTDTILEALHNKESGRNAIVLAPDSFLFAIENTVAEMGFALDVEVMSFQRLARAVLGNKIKRCLTPEGCTMIMTRAIHSCRNELIYYKKSLNRKGFVNEMYSTITALRNSGISPTDLSQAVPSMSGYVRNKTRDLITIYKSYLEILTKDYSDPTTRLEALCEAIPSSQYIRESEIYIVDFYTFNSKQYDVLDMLFKYAYNIHVGVIDAIGGLSPKSIYPYENTSRIIEIAKNSGCSAERVNAYSALDGFERFLMNDLFGLGVHESVRTYTDVELITPLTAFDEAKSVAVKIAELVRKGARYRDIAVVKGNIQSTQLESCFRDYNIPFFVDSKVPLTEEPTVKYLLLLIDCNISSYERDKVYSLMKNPLSLIDIEEGMIFQNYCDKYAVNYSRFTTPFVLGDDRERAIPEKVRASLVSQIAELPTNGKVLDYVEIIKQKLEDVDFRTRITEFFNKQLEGSDFSSIKRTSQITPKMMGAIDLMGELLSDYELSASDFYDVLYRGLESVQLSVIPLSADCVHIGESRDCKYENVKYLFVTGASDGNIPAESGSGTILTNKYHTDLQLYNMVVRPAVKEENRFAKFCLSCLLIKATKGLYISCPCNGLDGEQTIKSEIYDRLVTVEGVKTGTDFTHEKYAEYVTYKQCLDKVSIDLAKNGVLDEFTSGLLSVLPSTDKDKINNLYYERDNALDDGTVFMDPSNSSSVSKIENFYSCPYSFFLRYGLKARERDDGDVRVNETGSFIHAVLDRYFDENKDRIKDIDYVEAKAIAYRIGEELLETDDRLKGILSGSARIVANLKKEAAVLTAKLNELSKTSKFDPYRTEAEFGMNEDSEYPPITLSSGTQIRGKIDRIDRSGDNIIVIDYKTGFVKPCLSEVFYGEKVQLYVYLYALGNLGLRPVGAFYQHLDAAYSNDEPAPLAYRGQFICTPEVIDLLDPSFDSNESSEILPIVKKKGAITTIKGVKDEDTLLTEDDMDKITSYVKELLERADSLIKSGYIEAKPLAEKCKYCLGKNSCPIAGSSRKMEAVKIKDFELKKDEEVDE